MINKDRAIECLKEALKHSIQVENWLKDAKDWDAEVPVYKLQEASEATTDKIQRKLEVLK